MNNWLAYFACMTILEFTSYDTIFTVFNAINRYKTFLKYDFFLFLFDNKPWQFTNTYFLENSL